LLKNHDNQVNITHAEEIARERKVAPLSYTRSAPKGVGGEEGPGNYWVPVSFRSILYSLNCLADHFVPDLPKPQWYASLYDTVNTVSFSSLTDKSPSLILWFFDSRGKPAFLHPSANSFNDHTQAASLNKMSKILIGSMNPLSGG
jgi:hypothetical protein